MIEHVLTGEQEEREGEEFSLIERILLTLLISYSPVTFSCNAFRDYGSGLILTLRNSMSCPVRCRPTAPLLNCG